MYESVNSYANNSALHGLRSTVLASWTTTRALWTRAVLSPMIAWATSPPQKIIHNEKQVLVPNYNLLPHIDVSPVWAYAQEVHSRVRTRANC